jgi:hypothetical protein
MHYLSRQGPSCALQLWLRLFAEPQASILARAQCVVAVNPDDDNQIFGFAIGEPGATPLLWFCQVKKDFHRRGIADALLAAVGVSKDRPAIYAFPSPILAKVKRPQWTHVPWFLIPAKEESK